MYARGDDPAYRVEARYLRVRQASALWLFPKREIRQLVKLEKFTRLPPSARWESWPCLGLVSHGQSLLPVLCWQVLVSGYELTSTTLGVLLILRHAPVAIRVHDNLRAISVEDDALIPHDRLWSSGQTAENELVARLSRFSEGGGR